tara:strand:- start:42 stop:617 length:576 start_codon:yes stop_codon:yes gene_type:complete
MPNAILRAGPFASEDDSFLDQPEPINVNGLGAGIVPVNCASAFPFRTNISRRIDGASSLEAEIQLKESGSELAHASNTGQNGSHLLFVSFRYQAAIDFNITLNFVASVVADSARVRFLLQKSMGVVGQVTTLYSRNVSGSSLNVDLNEDFVISLPASVKPQFIGFGLNCTVFGSPTPVNLTSSASLILKPN